MDTSLISGRHHRLDATNPPLEVLVCRNSPLAPAPPQRGLSLMALKYFTSTSPLHHHSITNASGVLHLSIIKFDFPYTNANLSVSENGRTEKGAFVYGN